MNGNPGSSDTGHAVHGALARALPPDQLRAVLVAALNLRFAQAADFISAEAFGADLRAILADPTEVPPLTVRYDCHATAARRIVRDLSPLHLQNALEQLFLLADIAGRETRRRADFFTRYASLQLDALIEVAATVERTALPVEDAPAVNDMIRRRAREAA